MVFSFFFLDTSVVRFQSEYLYKPTLGFYFLCMYEETDTISSDVFLMFPGSDTGIGHALAKYLDNLGFVVFAGVLNEDGPGAEELRRTCSQRLSLLQLDITNATQVKEAYLKVSEKVQNTGTAFFNYNGSTNIAAYEVHLLTVGCIMAYVCRSFPHHTSRKVGGKSQILCVIESHCGDTQELSAFCRDRPSSIWAGCT
uniref:Hydroxysteroid 17-beta dehydrogenase 2 n=1 Tax=Strix occidentalis caurina TaxID=311401 RepID=A0A8D0EY67_STROC